MIKAFGPKVESNYSDVLSLSTIYGHAVTWPNRELFSTKYNAVRSVCCIGTRVIRGINIIVPFLLKASIVFLWRRDTMACVPLNIIGWLILRRTIIGVPTLIIISYFHNLSVSSVL